MNTGKVRLVSTVATWHCKLMCTWKCVFTLAQVGKRIIISHGISLAIKYVGLFYTEEIDSLGDFVPDFSLLVSFKTSIFQVSVPLTRRL